MTLESDVFDFSMKNGTLTEFLLKVNEFTDVGAGGVVGIFIMLVVGGALFFMMKPYGAKEALGISTIVVAILGIFLRLLLLINDFVFYISIALLIIGVMLLQKEASQYE